MCMKVISIYNSGIKETRRSTYSARTLYFNSGSHTMFSIIVTAAWASFAPTPPPPAAAVGTTQVVRPHSDFFLLYF